MSTSARAGGSAPGGCRTGSLKWLTGLVAVQVLGLFACGGPTGPAPAQPRQPSTARAMPEQPAVPSPAAGADEVADVAQGTSKVPGRPAKLTPNRTTLRIASWNLRRLGHGEKDLVAVARVVQTFDVIALEEVMDPAGVEALMAHLPGWRSVTSDAACRGRYCEHYAVLYRADRVTLAGAFTPPDPDDRFAREPYVTCMAAGTFDFCLVVAHIVFGKRVGPRDAEIRALGQLAVRLRAEGSEKDYLIVGDFNRQASAPGWDVLNENGWAFAAGDGEVPTTIGKKGYANAFDHILVDPAHTGELSGEASRFDLVEAVCGGDFAHCADRVSDHAPLGAPFRGGEVDDD